jgi:hypothetical protein
MEEQRGRECAGKEGRQSFRFAFPQATHRLRYVDRHGAARPPSTHFHQLNRKTGHWLRQQMVDRVTDKVVGNSIDGEASGLGEPGERSHLHVHENSA